MLLCLLLRANYVRFISNFDYIDQILAASVSLMERPEYLYQPKNLKNGYRMDNLHLLAYEGERHGLDNQRYGFQNGLSSYIPSIIESNIDHIMQPMFETMNITKNDIDIWAVHPGGEPSWIKLNTA